MAFGRIINVPLIAVALVLSGQYVASNNVEETAETSDKVPKSINYQGKLAQNLIHEYENYDNFVPIKLLEVGSRKDSSDDTPDHRESDFHAAADKPSKFDRDISDFIHTDVKSMHESEAARLKAELETMNSNVPTDAASVAEKRVDTVDDKLNFTLLTLSSSDEKETTVQNITEDSNDDCDGILTFACIKKNVQRIVDDISIAEKEVDTVDNELNSTQLNLSSSDEKETTVQDITEDGIGHCNVPITLACFKKNLEHFIDEISALEVYNITEYAQIVRNSSSQNSDVSARGISVEDKVIRYAKEHILKIRMPSDMSLARASRTFFGGKFNIRTVIVVVVSFTSLISLHMILATIAIVSFPIQYVKPEVEVVSVIREKMNMLTVLEVMEVIYTHKQLQAKAIKNSTLTQVQGQGNGEMKKHLNTDLSHPAHGLRTNCGFNWLVFLLSAILQGKTPFLIGFGLGFLAFGLKKLMLPLFIGMQIVKSVLIALFLPSILGGIAKAVGKGVSTFSQVSQGVSAQSEESFDFKENADIYSNDYMHNQPIGTLPASAMYGQQSLLNTGNQYPGSVGANQRISYVNSLSDNYYSRNAMQGANKRQDYKVFHEIPTSSLLLTNYDPFYSPLLSRLDAVFSRLGHSTEGCREYAICAMYKSPARYAPYSNLVSAQLSRELNELRKPTSDNPDVLRFFKYMKAAKDGQDGVECEDIYAECASRGNPSGQNQAMLATYQDINKLVQARKL